MNKKAVEEGLLLKLIIAVAVIGLIVVLLWNKAEPIFTTWWFNFFGR